MAESTSSSWRESRGFRIASRVVLGVGIGAWASINLIALPFTVMALRDTIQNGLGSIAGSAELGILYLYGLHAFGLVLLLILAPFTVFSFVAKGKPRLLCGVIWALSALFLLQFGMQCFLCYYL